MTYPRVYKGIDFALDLGKKGECVIEDAGAASVSFPEFFATLHRAAGE